MGEGLCATFLFWYFILKLSYKMTKRKIQIKKIITTAFFMSVFLFFLKYLPERIFGKDVLFDASFHITATFFFIYLFWFFVDQNKSWRIPYFILSALVLSIVSVQRILVDAHNDVGLLLGLCISIISIYITERNSLKNKITF